MAFKLPKYRQLTNNQRMIVNLPLDKNHLVVGGPGTGKTVLAIYRASDLVQAGKRVLLLVFNRPLMLYISAAVRSLGIQPDVNTWQAWLPGFYKQFFHRGHPKTNGVFSYDWEQIFKDFQTLEKVYDVVILDEAQDLPPELIRALTYVAKGISCFMDADQTVTSTSSDYQDVEEILDVNTSYRLKENYRNTKEIFAFAKLYNPHVLSSAQNRSGEKPKMIFCSGYGDADPTQLTSQMVQYIKRYSHFSSIGVFTTSQSQVNTYKSLKLREEEMGMEVYMYKSSDTAYRDIDFEKKGVFVLTFNCIKGLEFDAVIIPRCESIAKSRDEEERISNNKFYVAMTRASEAVLCFYFSKNSKGQKIDVFGPLEGHEDVVDWE